MARLPRVIAVGVPHHITQRGNAGRFILDADSDRAVYLELLHRYSLLHDLVLSGYCVMSNHVHLIAAPMRDDSLALTLKHVHGRYAAYFNARYSSTGHAWQGRYYSCPLDTPHLWAAMRYVERNPVRAGMAGAADEYPWSSAAAHCGKKAHDSLVDPDLWQAVWTAAEWREYLGSAEGSSEAEEIRRNTHTGRPLGSPLFVGLLEQSLQRHLRPGRGGRPAKRESNSRREALAL